MSLEHFGDSYSGRFDITPVIDIVFLLIIFFMIVCQFIVAENFQVSVPDDISSAQQSRQDEKKTTTVTVMFNDKGGVDYAVGAKIIPYGLQIEVSGEIAGQIDRQLKNLKGGNRLVSLRIDKNITYEYARHALAGISRSTAGDIKLSVIKQKVQR